MNYYFYFKLVFLHINYVSATRTPNPNTSVLKNYRITKHNKYKIQYFPTALILYVR